MDCKVYFFLGKETEWPSDKKKMAQFKAFLISHHDHILKSGGDEWNSAYDGKELLTDQSGWTSYD